MRIRNSEIEGHNKIIQIQYLQLTLQSLILYAILSLASGGIINFLSFFTLKIKKWILYNMTTDINKTTHFFILNLD